MGAKYRFAKKEVTYKSVCIFIHMMFAHAPMYTEQEAFCTGGAGQQHILPTCLLIPEHHCAPQVLYPSQPQDLQGPQGSLLTHNAKITAKKTHSVSFNPMPTCAYSLQGTLSNTPKPQMTRSPRVPS